MAWFKDFDRLTPFIKAFRPMLARQLDSNIEDVYNQMIRNWEQGQDAKGRAWAPNAPSTLRQKQGSTPLIETRQMIDSADYKTDRSNLQARITIEDDSGKVLAHEHGVPEQGIPPRPILSPTRDVIGENADSIMRQAFDRSWAKAAVSGTSVAVGFSNDTGAIGGGPR